MYKPKKHVRLSALPNAPKLSDVKTVYEEARKARGCTVELPWRNRLTNVNYSLTVRVELAGGDPVWTLYEGEANGSRVVWSSSFEDVELLYDVLTLSIPAEVSTEDFKSDDWRPDGADDFPEYQGSPKAPSKAPKADEKPPGYYESGLLKEEELEFFQKQETQRKQEDSKKAEREEAELREAEQREKEREAARKREAERKEAERKERESMQSGAYPASTQSGAYPQPQGDPSQQSGAYPYPPPGYPYAPPPGYPYPPPPGYQYPPPGYPPHPGYQYPQGYQIPPGNQSQNVAGTVAIQPGATPSSDKQTQDLPKPPSMPDKNKPNVRLGLFLAEAGIVPQATVDAALQLQDLVRSGSLPTAKAAEAVRRAHVRGGQVDPALQAIALKDDPNNEEVSAPPLGQILVEAAILRGPILKTALKLQQKVRDSQIDKDEAIDQLCVEVFGVSKKRGSKEPENEDSTKAVEILKSAGLISDFDLDTASKVKDKHGGRLINIMESAGKLDSVTVDAALKCVILMKEEKINLDKAAIALHYCQRSRVSLEEALGELGWKKSVLGIEDEEEIIEIIEYVEDEGDDIEEVEDE